ncbi:SRPBCC domain-containing protein [Bradyrhizobium sp. CCBAU 53421]|uniref:SRPBCC domain-containing protein n=1 Tax=Bradyrhizobium sp. CCBAU 53421 TaxID=1325120 RepID=UPI001AEE4197|nr:SRPBCC domain-containing protein [Bradyrhizobium sp. CCBAU 53421]
MDARVDKTLRITTPSDFEFAMTRQFDAPRRFVFDAMTKPEYLVRWLGCEQLTMPVCEVDLRVGGAYRFVFRSSEGIEHELTGTYREVVRPERLTFGETFSMPGFTSDEYLVISTFVEEGGTTTLTTTIRHPTKEARDGHLNSGIDKGVEPAYDRLAEVVAGMG